MFKYFVPIVGIIFIAFLTYSSKFNIHNRQEIPTDAMETIYAWARLSRIPKTSSNISIKASGSRFTREFVLEFDAPKSDISSWVGTCPGLLNAVRSIAPNGDVHFQIQPGAGAQFAELTILRNGSHILVRTYWS